MAKCKTANAAAFDKTVIEDLDYGVNWTKFLAGDTISTSAWTIESLNGETVPVLTKSDEANDNSNTSLMLAAGTLDTSYNVINKIVTASSPPKTAERTLRLSIVDKKPQNPC